MECGFLGASICMALPSIRSVITALRWRLRWPHCARKVRRRFAGLMRREYRIRRSSRNWEKSLVDSRWSLVVSVSDVCQRLCSASIDRMATITIRQLDEKTKTRLRVRAAHHGRSMEEEAREILRSALTSASPAKGNLAETIRRRFAALGGLELELPRRDPMR